MPLSLKAISEGAPFDTNEAIRLIAGHLDQSMGGEQLNPLGAQGARKAVTPVTQRPGAEHEFGLRFGSLASTLIDGGFDTLEKVKAASDDKLLALPDMNKASLSRVRNAEGK